MVMKVSGVNNIVFRSAQVSTPDSFMPENKVVPQIKELSSVTPDYQVVVPVNYKKTAVDKLDNGLEVYSYKMSNGYKVTIVPMKSEFVALANGYHSMPITTSLIIFSGHLIKKS